MSVHTKQLAAERQVKRIVEALFTLPSEKLAEVDDFVAFLQARHGQPSAVDVSETWDEQELPDLTDDLSAYDTTGDDAIAEHRHSPSLSPPPAFLESVATFDRLLPQLLEQYRGQAVAISQGRVIASGPDKMSVWEQVIAEYGQIPCYIEWVEPDVPRKVRMPSVRVVR
ncbi:MAG: hypothetical protein HY328_07385 [Chloroflexi bacterium]|nr:hypothetical protein [Chloroflexota bacterium]